MLGILGVSVAACPNIDFFKLFKPPSQGALRDAVTAMSFCLSVCLSVRLSHGRRVVNVATEPPPPPVSHAFSPAKFMLAAGSYSWSLHARHICCCIKHIMMLCSYAMSLRCLWHVTP